MIQSRTRYCWSRSHKLATIKEMYGDYGMVFWDVTTYNLVDGYFPKECNL
jgi:hypothetical protein